jgi:uncharacterized membrane protein
VSRHAYRKPAPATRRLLGALLIPAALATVIAMIVLWPARPHSGDGVVMLYGPDAVPGGRDYVVTDRQRTTPLIWLLALSGAAVLAFGRLRGLSSLAGLAVSVAILLFFVIPALLDGSPPLLIAVVGASAVMFAALYLTTA